MSSVLFLVTHSAAGGVQELWGNLAQAFRDRGFKVDLAALYPPAIGEEAVTSLPWLYVVPERPASMGARLRLLPELVRFLRHKRPDLIVTAMPAANVLTPVAARLSGGTPVVTSHHSPVGVYNAALNAADYWIGCLPTVQTVVSVSQSVAASLEGKPRRYRAKRRTIHNALPPNIERLLATLAGTALRQARSRTIVAIGRLAPEKNYPMLLRALAHMADVTLELVGAGPEADMLQALAHDLGVAARVRFLGQFPREDALRRLAAGDVFVQVSLFEGHSLALLEAAKLGMPLVVSSVPSQIEGLTAADGTRCGITVDAADHLGLAREILSLLDNPRYYAYWAAKARALGGESTYDAMIASYLELAAS